MDDRDKSLVWLYGEIKTPPFSDNARIEAGFLLRRLQRGDKLSMPQSRPMPEESAFIEMKLALCDSVKSMRTKKRLSQTEFAKLISSSQSRVAKIEAGDPSVSIDLVMKSLLCLGATKKDVAKLIAAGK